MLEELRCRLVSLYADLAAHTKPECTSRSFVTLGSIKVDSIMDHFWTPANPN
jgi:hypothetical protein